MNLPNHVLTAYNIERFVVPHQHTGVLVLSAIIFSILPDIDIVFSKLFLHKPNHHLRTWFQEPISILFVALPLGLVAKYYGYSALLVLIPWSLHVIFDYLTVHEVSALAPFSDRVERTARLFIPYPKPRWYDKVKDHGLISELWLLLANILLLFVH